eukprot:358710-Chlamydomonas_euryale.AAC.3
MHVHDLRFLSTVVVHVRWLSLRLWLSSCSLLKGLLGLPRQQESFDNSSTPPSTPPRPPLQQLQLRNNRRHLLMAGDGADSPSPKVCLPDGCAGLAWGSGGRSAPAL